MPNKDNLYYYIDIDLHSLVVVGWGTTEQATLTGDSGDPLIHRVFLTKGQYNKLKEHLKKL